MFGELHAVLEPLLNLSISSQDLQYGRLRQIEHRGHRKWNDFGCETKAPQLLREPQLGCLVPRGSDAPASEVIGTQHVEKRPRPRRIECTNEGARRSEGAIPLDVRLERTGVVARVDHRERTLGR
jgi:hypothetical protein